MHVEPSYPSSVTHGGRSTVLGASRAGPVCVFVGLSVCPSVPPEWSDLSDVLQIKTEMFYNGSSIAH